MFVLLRVRLGQRPVRGPGPGPVLYLKSLLIQKHILLIFYCVYKFEYKEIFSEVTFKPSGVHIMCRICDHNYLIINLKKCEDDPDFLVRREG